MDSILQQKEHFESISQKYYESRQLKTHLLLKHLMWQYFFLNLDFLKNNNMKVLEPMCGYAEGKAILEKHLNITFEYEGFDYSKPLIEKAKIIDPSLNIYLMDVTQFKADKRYDLIILLGGLHHIPQYASDVVENLSKALKPDGYFINLEPTHNNVLFKKIRNYIYNKNNLFDNDTEKAFELDNLNDIYTSNKLEIIKQIYPGLISYILYYNPDAFRYLNIGGCKMTKFFFEFDKPFFKNYIGRKLSFATLSLLKKS